MALPVAQPGDELPPNDPGGSGSGGGGGSGGGTSAVVGTIIRQGSYTKDDADSLLFVTVFANLQAVDDLRCIGYLIVNGVVEQAQPINLILDTKPSAAAAPMPLAFAVDNLPAGPVQLAFAVRNVDPSGSLTVRKRTLIRIEEIKSPAR